MLSSDEYDNCGVSKPSARMSLSDKGKVVEAMCLHFSILPSLAELEQLCRGLPFESFPH